MITKLLKILGTLLTIILIYVIFLKGFPSVGPSIDNKLNIKLNGKILEKTDMILEKVVGAKGTTDDAIDGVGTNTKNKSKQLQGTLDDMRNAN